MSDRSYMAITILDCPEDKQQALHDLLSEFLGLVNDDGATLALGEQYIVEEIVLGADDELYHEIATQVGLEGLAFDLQQEPKYEFDGARTIYLPGLGSWSAPVNSAGEPIVTWTALEPVLGDPAAVRRLFGRPWIEVLDLMRVSP